MKLLNTIRILSGALFISLCCLTASCNFLEIVPVEQADLDDATQDFNSTLGFLHSCYAGIQSPVAFENTEASADEYAVPLEYSLQGYNSLKVAHNLFTGNNNDGGKWSNYYRYIGQIHLFLQELKKAPVSDLIKEEWEAEAYFLMAYYHFEVLRCYGPCPISDRLLPQTASENEYPGRMHYDYVTDWIVRLLDEKVLAGDKLRNTRSNTEVGRATRPTTSASNQSGKINFVTDLIAWNRYDGWYGGTPQDLGKWLDWMHKEYPEIRIAISEYGAGASIYHQQDSLVKTNPTSWWHPENWQTYYHIENWKAITERPFVWGSFVWNMFDFGAAHRTEGDRPGVNDKGLVTFDRKVRKDAFYFYKANWNKEDPMIYLIGKRNIIRVQRQQTIIAFSNQPEAELFVNGKSCGKVETDRYSILEWKHVILTPGKNKIEVKTTNKKQTLTDMYYCIL